MKTKYTCQQYDFEKINPNKKFLARPTAILKSLSAGERRVLSLFRNMGNKPRLYFRQTWIAKMTKLSRGTVNTIIKKFCEFGLIAKKYRHMDTSNYRVSDFLLYPNPVIKKILLLICIFSVQMLQSRPIFPPFKNTDCNNESISDMQKTGKRDLTHNKENTIRRKSDSITSKVNIYINPSIINGRSTVNSFNKEDFIPPLVNSLHTLNLTWDQKFRLAPFPHKALDYAYQLLKYSNGAKNSYAWFKYFCEQYCIEKDIKPNFRLYYQLKDVYGEPQKEEKAEVKQVAPIPKVAYSYKLPMDYLALKQESPLYVFSRMYRQYLNGQKIPWISDEANLKMGVANMVEFSFYGYCGAKDTNFTGIKSIAPDAVLAHLDSLIESSQYTALVAEFGLDAAALFLQMCFDGIIAEQEKVISRYGVWQTDYSSTPIVFTQQILYRTQNVDEFMKSDNYSYLAEIMGDDVLKSFIYIIVQNWMKIIQ